MYIEHSTRPLVLVLSTEQQTVAATTTTTTKNSNAEIVPFDVRIQWRCTSTLLHVVRLCSIRSYWNIEMWETWRDKRMKLKNERQQQRQQNVFFYRFRIEWRRDSESGMANTIARRVKREWDKLVCTLRGDRYSSGAFPIVLQCFCLFSSLSLPLARYTPITIAHHPIVFVFALTVQNDWIEIKRRHDWNCELFDNLTMIVTVSHLGCRKAERTSVFCQNNW